MAAWSVIWLVGGALFQGEDGEEGEEKGNQDPWITPLRVTTLRRTSR